MEKLILSISADGVSFVYYHDEITWIWPWKRDKFSHRYISWGCEGVFKSRKDIRKFWDDYHKAMEQDHE